MNWPELRREMEERLSKATKGPWFWRLDRKGKRLILEAAVSTYEVVMDFVRWGMGGAVARFRDTNDIMHHADEFAIEVPGREHHASWYMGIRHPDADFIAHARTDLPAALARVTELESELAAVKADRDEFMRRLEIASRQAKGF